MKNRSRNETFKVKVEKTNLDSSFDELLTPRQILFVEEFMVDLNCTQAAIRAGYSKETAHTIGSENLKKPYIQYAVRLRLKSRVNDLREKQEWVIDELVRHYFEASEAVPVLDVQGRRTGLWKCERLTALRCLELIGKHLGMFNGEGVTKEDHPRGRVVIVPPDSEKLKCR